jgi:RHS repeat-associated protein
LTRRVNFVYEGTTYEYANLSWSGRELTKIQIYNDMGINEYTIDYQYNDQGYRTNQTISYNNGSTWGTIKSIDYELVDDRVIYESGKEYNQNNQEIKSYEIIYTYDYDGTLISFNYKDDTHVSADYFYLRNQQGDITHIINSSGTTIIKYKYDAYGNIIDEYIRTGYQHIFDHNSYTYRGYRYDSNIELYYLNSRYYSPEVGRFINTDGLLGSTGNITDTNMYVYALNNPVMRVDPSGYWSWKKVAVVAAIVTVVVVATVISAGTASAAIPVLVGVAKGAAVGAITSGLTKGVSNAIDGKNFFNGVGDAMIDGALDGSMIGGLGSVVTFMGLIGKTAYSAYGAIGMANYSMNQLIDGNSINEKDLLFNGVLSATGARLDDLITAGDSLQEGAIIVRKTVKWLLYDVAPNIISKAREAILE